MDAVVIDGSGRAGKGVAYSTTEPAHLLNVRAEGMSAWADDKQHFARRFAEEGGDARGFAQRRLFGRYLGEMLEEAVASGRTTVVERVAVGASRDNGQWAVTLDEGEPIAASAVVLCTGNEEPDALGAFGRASGRFITNPWGGAAQAAVRALACDGGDALLIGTGLTMVDLVLSLDAGGFSGRIVALSRRGLIPRSHSDFSPAPVDAADVPHGDVGALLRWLRRRSADVGWRAAIDSLRPHSHGLWQSLDGAQQRRFLRHARPWWDVHRHRIAPEVGETIARLVAEDRLHIIAGRIISVEEGADGLNVELRRRGRAESERMQFDHAFNCTGPLQSIHRTRDPLLRSLLDSGEAKPDDLGMGLTVDEACRAGDHLWALGPLTKGRYWEIIAVPDIREQAAAVAENIARELQQ